MPNGTMLERPRSLNDKLHSVKKKSQEEENVWGRTYATRTKMRKVFTTPLWYVGDQDQDSEEQNEFFNNRSSANIVFGSAFNQIEVDHMFGFVSILLYGFTRENIVPKENTLLTRTMPKDVHVFSCHLHIPPHHKVLYWGWGGDSERRSEKVWEMLLKCYSQATPILGKLHQHYNGRSKIMWWMNNLCTIWIWQMKMKMLWMTLTGEPSGQDYRFLRLTNFDVFLYVEMAPKYSKCLVEMAPKSGWR